MDLPISTAALAVLAKTANAVSRPDEFFKATIKNLHTRRAYGRMVGRFLGWCENQALAALRHFLDAWCSEAPCGAASNPSRPFGSNLPPARRYHKPMQELRRITIDPEIMGGKPCIRGMRVTVGMIVEAIASGRTTPELLADFPYLEEQDVREALSFAATLAHGCEAHTAS